MKKFLKILSLTLMLAVFSVSFVFAACSDKKKPINTDPPSPTHVCESKCPVCGGCLDMECMEPECLTKCGDAYAYASTFTVAEDFNIATTGLTYDKSKGYYVGFDKTNEGALVFSFTSEETATMNLVAYVYKSAEEDIFTDVIETTVNGEKLDRSSVIHSGSTSEIATVNLGCINVVGGENTISFVAEGDGAHAHEFTAIQIAYEDENSGLTTVPAVAVEHTCKSVCEVCGGCTDFSCLNPGCTNKCSCQSGTHKATIFTVLDNRCDNHGRGINAERDGVGCSWGKTTTITYIINSSIAGTVKFGAVVSADTVVDRLFTDQFVVTVNGERVTATGTMPIAESNEREWNNYSMIVVGDITLKEGLNTIELVQTPDKNVGCAYNFQSIILFSEEGTFSWNETVLHTMEHTPAKAATCKETGNIEYWYCTDCGKYFSDEAGNFEISESELITPIDTNNHTEALGEDGFTITCSLCGNLVGYNFNAIDDRCVFTGAEKNIEGNCLPGKNGTMTTITYYVVTDKDATVSMYVNCSAIATSWEIPFNDTWTVAVTTSDGTETPYSSETIHHNWYGKPDSVEATDRFDYFADEYVCDVQLKAGLNKIVFTGTGKEQLNFRALIFKNLNGAQLSWGEAPSEEGSQTEGEVPVANEPVKKEEV